MTSKEAQEAVRLAKEHYEEYPDWTKMDFAAVRKGFEEMSKNQPTAKGVTWKSDFINDVSVERVFVPEAGEKIILYMHGGAMVMGSPAIGRFMLTHVAKLSKRNAVGVDYRLCPEYSQPAAVENCAKVYRALLTEGNLPENIALFGESAGGILVLSLCAYLKKNNIPMPGCACAISCSGDCEYHSQSMTRNVGTEVAVNANIREMMKALYYKDGDPKDPVLSPIYSDLAGWPPVYFLACREEILLDESIRMYLKLQEAGVETEISIAEGLFHTYMLQNLPESYDAFLQIANYFLKY